jgi:N-acyl-D-aspartate/D-glutamate deacylase
MKEEVDILIKNVTIVDGTGKSSFKGSIGVVGDRISAVGDPTGISGERVIDAEGLTASPGFIDVHSHGDITILYYPQAEGYVHQGITTFVGGNCGLSPAPVGDMISYDWFLDDIRSEIVPFKYYPPYFLPRELLNTKHREVYGWEIDWHTMGEYFRRVEKEGLSPNYVPLVGHHEIRSVVMGKDYKRSATGEETKEMREVTREAMEDGCRGISVGRDYEPSYYANTEELFALAEVVAEYGGVYSSHSLRTGLRRARKPGDPPQEKVKGILEAIEVGRITGVSVQISHLLGPLHDITPNASPNLRMVAMEVTFKLIDDARKEDIDVNFDIIPDRMTVGLYFTPYLARLLAPWLRETGSVEQFARALKMKAFKEEVKATIYNGKWYGLNPYLSPKWSESTRIAKCAESEFEGKSIAQIAEEQGVDPMDVLMEVLAADPLTKTSRGDSSFKTPLEIPLLLYAHPEMMIGIDTFALDDKWEFKTPPWFFPSENAYGGFPRYFRTAVREERVLSLEEAVRKVTSLPARKFKLQDRGVLKIGAWADIVLMDINSVTDMGDYFEPRRYPKGIEYVFVNGIPVSEKGKHTGARPGKILKREK